MTHKSLSPLWFFILASISVGTLCCVQFYGNEFLQGWDAYYYLLKTTAWFKHNQWAVADGNFVHLLLSPFKWLGFSPQQAWQLWTGVSIICFLLSFSKNVRTIKKPVWAAVIFTWAALSPSLFYLAVDFPKTFLALICFNFVFFYTITKKPIPWCLFACATILLHKIMLPYVGLCSLWLFWQNRQKENHRLVWGAIGILGIFWLLLQQTAPFSITLADLTRFTGGNLTPGILYLIGQMSLPSGLRLELILSLLLGIAMLWRYPKPTRYIALGWLPALLPVGSAETFGLGERTALLLPYMMMLSCLYLADTLPNVKRKIRWYGWLLIAGGMLLVAFFRPGYALPSAQQENEQNLLLANALRPYQPALLITNRRFSYFYKFHTGLESFPFEPEDDWDKTAIWRLVSGTTAQTLRPFLPANCQKYMHEIRLPAGGASGHILLREDCYVALRADVTPNVVPLYPLLHTNTINPWKQRPAFLRKKIPGHTRFPAE